MREKKEDVVHSTVFGSAQNVGGIGVASTQNFDERMRVEQNRQKVQKYNESRIASQRNFSMQAKKYTPPEKTVQGEAKGMGGAKVARDGARPISRSTVVGRK